MASTTTAGIGAGRRRGRALIALFIGLAALTAGSGALSLAVFTDSSDATGAFSTGTVDLVANPTTVFNASGIVPGASGSATVTVSNTGTGTLRYAMTSASTDADGKGLRDQLELTVVAGACPGAGAPLFGAAAIAGAAFGDPTQGDDVGDRTLAAGTSEDLCFAWSLPLSTGDAFQNAATTTTFTFGAEQTANNP
jgi:hypothetical protein